MGFPNLRPRQLCPTKPPGVQRSLFFWPTDPNPPQPPPVEESKLPAIHRPFPPLVSLWPVFVQLRLISSSNARTDPRPLQPSGTNPHPLFQLFPHHPPSSSSISYLIQCFFGPVSNFFLGFQRLDPPRTIKTEFPIESPHGPPAPLCSRCCRRSPSSLTPSSWRPPPSSTGVRAADDATG